MNSNPLILTITLCLFFFFLLHHYIITPVAGDYKPVENIALDCGSSTDSNTQDRYWIGDLNANISFSEEQPNTSRTSNTREPLTQIQGVPYGTARISRSKFTYTFRVSPGPKFVRLYFSPTNDDPDFNRSTGFFSVQTGRFTLLDNFSAALNADSLGLQGFEGFAREFCLFVEDGRNLSLTFTPSPDISDSYAFINGIEVVSMPDYLYYSAINDTGFKLLGQQNPYRINENDHALELMYRVNVGGDLIAQAEDTGLYRTWSQDNQYLTDARPSVLLGNNSINLSWIQKIHSYAAPENVYKTARTMGNNKTTNQNYNITWEFIVDSAFIYLVRLHFCELQFEVTDVGFRVFEIFIANQTAEPEADVIAWTNNDDQSRNGIPIYRDYAVMIGKNGNEKKHNLSIAMHPAPAWRTKYSDSILNGIEIFKISNNSGNLAGPNPDPVLKIQPDVVQPNPKSKNKRVNVLAIAGALIAGIVVIAAAAFTIILRRRLKVKKSGFSDNGSGWAPDSSTKTKSTKTYGSPLPSDLCRHFSLSDIIAATNNFDSVFIIGVGGFGNVYKGFINGRDTPVAIKRLDPGSQQGAHEFKNEIEMLSQLRHLHLVSLIGYCVENQEMILVYDYMPRGTLRDHLYKTDNPPLPWNQRLEICKGAARGLHYLHTGAMYKIIHRDVKTTNILLDDKWVAKVSDFGLSKLGPTDISNSHVSTVVKGTFGYLDPEYCRRQQLTEKSDVYSFGVVLLEVLFARPPLQKGKVEKNQVSLAVWAQECYEKGTLDQNIDPFLKGEIAPDCLKKFSEVAVSCLHRDGIERPSMGDVVWGLEFAQQLQEGAKEAINLGGAHSVSLWGPTKDSSVGFLDEINSNDIFSSDGLVGLDSKTSGVTTTSSDRHSSLSDNSERLTSGSGAVFSELLDPKAR